MFLFETVKHIYSILPCSDGANENVIAMDSKVLGNVIAITPLEEGTRAVITYAVGPNPAVDWELLVTSPVTKINRPPVVS